jgi:DNA-binding MarR family transcriptional regulator
MELVSRVHLGWRRHVARELAPYGVNPKQIFLLRALDRTGGMGPAEIAELLFADRPTVSSMLATLERAQWISRRRDPDNGKRVIVELTAAGRRKLASVPESAWRSGKTRVDPEGGLSRAERAALIRLLEKLDATIARYT